MPGAPDLLAGGDGPLGQLPARTGPGDRADTDNQASGEQKADANRKRWRSQASPVQPDHGVS